MALSKRMRTTVRNQAALEERFPAPVILEPGAVNVYAPVSHNAIVHMYNVALPTLQALTNQEAAAALQVQLDAAAADLDRKTGDTQATGDANTNAITPDDASDHERAARELLREALEDA